MPLEFVKYSSPKSSLGRKVLAIVSTYNTNGDWITPTPSLFDVANFCKSVITESIGDNRKYSQHNDLEVTTEKSTVYITVKSVMTGDKTKLCGFEMK